MNRLSWHDQTRGLALATILGLGLGLVGCEEISTGSIEAGTGDSVQNLLGKTLTTENYEATATTVYTWQAEYLPQNVSQDRPNDRRIETFESSYRVNLNGEPAVQDFGEPDYQGLWWPALPPKPTVDDLEARQKQREVFEAPQLRKSVEYTLTFEQGGELITVATNDSVYREAVKGLQAQRPLQIAFGREEAYIRQAAIQ